MNGRWLFPYTEQTLKDIGYQASSITLSSGIATSAKEIDLLSQLEKPSHLGRFFHFKYIGVCDFDTLEKILRHDLTVLIHNAKNNRDYYVVVIAGTLSQWFAACEDPLFTNVRTHLEGEGWYRFKP